MNPYNLSLLFFGSCSVFMGLLVWLKRQDSVGKYYLLFSFFATGWAIGVSMIINQDASYDFALLGARLCNGMASLIPIMWIRFVFSFLDKKEPFNNFYTINFVLALLIALSAFTPWLAKGLAPILDFKYYTLPGPFFYVFTAIFFTLIPYSFYQLISAYFKSTGEYRNQLKYLVIGSLIAFGSGGATFLPVFRIPLPQYLLFFMPLYPLVMAIGLVRYGLFDAQEIADAFQREKMAVLGTMAASLNHEIKNPLFVVRGKAECYLDALERKKYSSSEELYEAGKQAINPILNQTVRALDIIQKFTDFARPFNVKSPKEQVILSEVFQDVRELVSSEFQRSEVKLVHNLIDGLAVMANRRHIEEILSNLMINACHAVGDNGGQVSVTAESVKNKVKIQVSDTGPGISKENLEKVFKPFFTTKGPKGSGLGLYITKQLVERNGGEIKVDSKLGLGTTFRLEFAKR